MVYLHQNPVNAKGTTMHRHPLLSLLLLFALLAGMSSAPISSQAQTDDTVKHYFDLTVSLEWQPGTDDLRNELERSGCTPSPSPSYLDDLSTGLRQTSAYLYNYSAGQLALRNIKVYTNGEHWEDADLRILATNSYRPSAFVGGIVSAPTSNISATKGMTETVFYPATIFLGRMWDGNGSRCGPWSQPAGWRTIGHEWAHYALFLYDSYYNVTTNAQQYCTSTGLQLGSILDKPGIEADSLMAYHYSADHLWKGGPPAPGNSLWNCSGTPQDYIHGEDDWHTVARFLPVTIPEKLSRQYPYDSSPAASNFSIAPAATPTTDTTAEVRIKALDSTTPPIGQAYLIRPDGKGMPVRIIGQGEIIPGEKAPTYFWGVQPSSGDRALITLPDWNAGKRYSVPLTQQHDSKLNVSQLNQFEANVSSWNPSISIVPLVQDLGATSTVIGLYVSVEDCANTTIRPIIVYCPAGGDCSPPAEMTYTNGVHTHTFSFRTGTPLYGYIYILNRDEKNPAEIATWYQLGGGVGPATGDGHAPLADSWADATSETLPTFNSPTTDDSRLLYSPALRCTADHIHLPNDVAGLIGQPLELQPVLGNPNSGNPWHSRYPTLRVRLSYNQDLLDRLGINENQLVVLRLVDPVKNVWETVPIVARSFELDWVAIEKQVFQGSGAIYALGYRNIVHLPLLMR